MNDFMYTTDYIYYSIYYVATHSCTYRLSSLIYIRTYFIKLMSYVTTEFKVLVLFHNGFYFMLELLFHIRTAAR